MIKYLASQGGDDRSVTSGLFCLYTGLVMVKPQQKAAATARSRSTGSIEIAYRAPAELTLNPRNPRLHSLRQTRQIARSIEAFGFIVPILVDSDLQVIAGHGRVLAARQLGLERVPTIRLEHLTDAQAKAFMIADNRLTENSTWDERLLAEQLRELSVLDLDFSLEATGFEVGEIDLKIEGLAAPSDEDDPAEAIPETSTGPTVSQVGDLWLLGRHRVYCGSALEEGAYIALMRDQQAAAVFVDPPYNVRIEGNVSGLGALRHRDFVMASGEMSEAEFTAFLTRACALLARHSRDGSLHFVCMDWRHMGELLAAGREVYTELKNLCIWAKVH